MQLVLDTGAAVEPGPAGPGAGPPRPSRAARVTGQSPIVVHSHLRWDFVWQRPQQILSRLAANHPVLFLEEPVREGDAPGLRISEPMPNVVRAIPLLRPDCGISVEAQCAAFLPCLEEALRSHPLMAGRFGSPVQWFYSPMTAPCLLGRFGATAIVYDCMDELANFRFAPPDMADRERFLISHADVVFTGGRMLYESRSRHHANVHFFGCGVDFGHFAAAGDRATVPPPAVRSLARPVLGYFGVIDERLDYDLLARLAGAFPRGSIVMVGPLAKVDASALPQAPNIHWLGQQAYADLPALVKCFDVCLMPFALNEATRYINPTKTLEYLAAGKPVVSTAIADVVRNFAPVVRIAADAESFVRAVRQACESPDAAMRDRGIALAQASTWDAIVARMRRRMVESG